MSKNKMFKITSGEMIITEIVSENDTELTIKAPMLVHFTPTPEGKLGINLFPLNPFATSTDENISLKKDHIIFFVDINKDIENEYTRVVSGIEVATSIPKIEIPN